MRRTTLSILLALVVLASGYVLMPTEAAISDADTNSNSDPNELLLSARPPWKSSVTELSDRYVGKSTLDVTVTDDAGNPVANETVTVVDDHTGEKVFQGTTDNAGVIDVTLPQGTYEVLAQDQHTRVHLKEDEDVTFTVRSQELPKT